MGGAGGRLKIEIVRREVKHFQGVCNQPRIVAGARGSAGRLSAELRVGFVSTPADWNVNGGLCDTTMRYACCGRWTNADAHDDTRTHTHTHIAVVICNTLPPRSKVCLCDGEAAG